MLQKEKNITHTSKQALSIFFDKNRIRVTKVNPSSHKSLQIGEVLYKQLLD